MPSTGFEWSTRWERDKTKFEQIERDSWTCLWCILRSFDSAEDNGPSVSSFCSLLDLTNQRGVNVSRVDHDVHRAGSEI